MREADVAPATLMRLAAQAMVAFLGHAPRFEVESRAGVWKIMCGEPGGDLLAILLAAAIGHHPGTPGLGVGALLLAFLLGGHGPGRFGNRDLNL